MLHQPRPLLVEMPVICKEPIVGMLDVCDRLSIEKTCRELRVISRRLPLHLQHLHLEVLEARRLKIHVNSGKVCHETTSPIDDMMPFFRRLLNHPRSTLEQLNVRFSRDDEESNEHFATTFGEWADSREHRSQVQRVQIDEIPENADEFVLQLLAAIRPGVLRSIGLQWQMTMSLRRIERLEQWQQARELDCFQNYSDEEWTLARFGHFRRLSVCLFAHIGVTEMRDMMEVYKAATSCNIRIHVFNRLNHADILVEFGIAKDEEADIGNGVFFVYTDQDIRFFTADQRRRRN